MKKLFTLIAAIVGLASVANVQGDNFYAGGFGGVNWLQNNSHHGSGSGRHHNKSRVGYVLGLDAGYKWCNGFRAELEVSYRNNRLKRHSGGGDEGSSNRRNNNTQIWAALVNGLYAFEIDCFCVKPYIGAGIGVASHRRFGHRRSDGSNSSHKRKAGFAWQLIAGLEYPCDCVDLDLSYSFFRTTERSNNHGLRLGANYNF